MYEAGVTRVGLPRVQIHTIRENGSAKLVNILDLLRTGNGVKKGKITRNHAHCLQACPQGKRGRERQSLTEEGHDLHCPKLLVGTVFKDCKMLPYKPRWHWRIFLEILMLWLVALMDTTTETTALRSAERSCRLV